VKRTPLENISAIADGVLADVERAQMTKVAEIVAVRAATPKPVSEMGSLLHKLAEEMRSTSVEVTYDDIADVMRGRV
jgi:hypothetical protein